MRLAAGGFVVHLVLIALARSIPWLNTGVLSELDPNSLMVTPRLASFSRPSLTSRPRLTKISHEFGRQAGTEIVSLIIILVGFSDIGQFAIQ